MKKLQVNQTLLNAVIDGTHIGLEMTGATPTPVGANRFFNATHKYSVIIGFSGESSGTLTLNLGERALLLLTGRLLETEFKEANEEVFDAIMELGNMVGGSIKEKLLDTEFGQSALSLPSLVLGASYNLYYSRGINTVTVTFELEDIPVMYYEDRFFSVTVSLLRASAS